MTKFKIVAVVMIALATTSPAGAATGDAGGVKAKEASAALQRGHADQAVLLYSAALEDTSLSNDRRAAFLNDRGVANARLNRLKAAIEDFNMSVRLAPEGASAYNNRGNVLMALGHAAEAEKDFNRALILAPGYAAAYANRANARILSGDSEGALRDFSHSARLAPKAPAAYGGRGRLHLANNRPHAAVRDFSRAVGNDERYGPGYRLRAEAMVLLGRFDEAIEDLSRAVAFDPTNADLYLARGYAYLAARNIPASITDFRRGVELDVKASAPLEGLALAQARSGSYENALDTLSRALAVEPRSGQAYAYRAIIYKLMGQLELGLKDLERAVRLDQGRPEVRWARGELLEAEGNREEAVAELRLALAGRPHLRDAAMALERLGAQEARDTEIKELAFDRWRVFVDKGRYYTTNSEHPRLIVPLETMSSGAVPQIVEFEVKGGAHAGIGILRFLAGQVEGPSGVEDIEHGAVLDLDGRSVLAVETTRQGAQQASWVWADDRLVVTGLDGFKQEYEFKGLKAREIAAAQQASEAAAAAAAAGAPAAARSRSRPQQGQEQATWVPWGPNWNGGFGNGVKTNSHAGGNTQQRPAPKPKGFFQMLFGN